MIAAQCLQCGREFTAKRTTSIYCGPHCRKQASRRTAVEASVSDRDRAIGTWLRKHMLIAKVWPVMHDDPSAPVYALMTSRDNTLAELNLELRHDFGPVAMAEFAAVTKRLGIREGSIEDLIESRRKSARVTSDRET